MVFIFMLTDLNTKETGETISNMVMAQNTGLMVASIKVCMLTPRRRAKVNTSGPMVTSTSVSGAIMQSMVLVSTSGPMAEFIAVSG
jgi:hypothetical protein